MAPMTSLASAIAAIPAVPFNDGIEHTHVEAHHSAGIFPVTFTEVIWELQSIYNYHVNLKGWRYIFYNDFIAPNGLHIVGRGPGNRSYGTAKTVCFLGNFHAGDRLTPAAKATFLKIADETGGRENIDWHRHRAAGTRYASACPGDSNIPWLQAVKAGAATEEEPTMAALDDHLSKAVPPGEYEPGSVHYMIRNIHHQVIELAAKQASREFISAALAELEVPASRPGVPASELATLLTDKLSAAYEAAAAELES